jgi:hypothetical protein
MSKRDPNRQDERLRAAFASLADGAPASPPCPDPDAIWQGARGELPPEVARGLVAHLSSCAPCAEAWRLARDLEPAAPAPARSVAPRSWLALAATIVIALGAAALWQWQRSDAPSEYRTTEDLVIRSLVPEDRPLPRARFQLRWTAGPAGTRFDVRLSSASLVTLVHVRGLTTSELVVPVERVADLPPGARLLWQVEARLPNGQRVASPTFMVRLQ